MNSNKPTLQEKIARLRASFISQLPKRLEEAQHQLILLKADPCMNRVAAVELHRTFHSLKGTGYSFGFHELAGIAGDAEDYTQQLLDLPDERTPPQWPDRLIGLLQELASQAQILVYTDMRKDQPLETPFFEMNDSSSDKDSKPGACNRLVYICDDEIDQVTHLSYQLRCFGYQVEHFTETQEFDRAVMKKRPDAVVMDVRFPHGGTAGTDALANIQKVTGQQLPAIVLSGRDDFEARLSAVRAGCQSYFTKPARPLELATALDEVMEEEVFEPYRILIVDDEPEVAQYHSLILEEAGMLVHELSQPANLLATLQEFRPDLVLLDVYMPDCTGQELSALIRQFPEYLSLPIVYLSSETDRQKQFSAMQVGVEGFITKPVIPEELVAAVALRAERMRSLRALMVRDSLTGLYNHTTTTELIEGALAQAKRKQESLAMVMLDLDSFKEVNDNYGHVAGDQVLLALSRILRHRLRTNDIVGRYGGEEFAILLKDVTPQVAFELVDQLREDFSKIRFSSGQQEFYCTFSAGISSFPFYLRAEELRIAADKVLYRAKKEGRNQVKLDDGNE
ncbi:diguanylate cyclase (GGDEF) domain-containing protein [Marinospirillum celere]|uniref:diguanylate cyclase n=1 Tax=Marinospirillum celere TaxID=1122252 RepID=A0A1I1ESE7_9GAMM|nr:diguanylate cyclase [Marinospirillum celere]SFB87823.1 diguanylate cyclase (GGDEF) domain-containing protein [Marinospirillum celere]